MKKLRKHLADDAADPAASDAISFGADADDLALAGAMALANTAGEPSQLAESSAENVPESPDEDTVPGNTATTLSLAAGDAVFGDAAIGFINMPGDQDWYQITLMAGQSYAIATLAFSSSPHVRLLDANGNVLASHSYDPAATHPGELTEQLPFSSPADVFVFDVETSGTYYIAMQDSDPEAAGGLYVLAAMQLPDDTVPGSTATTSSMAAGDGVFGDAVSGFVDAPGDQDWHQITLTAGHSYQFAVSPNTQVSVQPLVRLLDADGNVLASRSSSSLTFYAATSGTYYLSVQDIDADFAGGGYLLAAKQYPTFTIPQIADQLINGWPVAFGGSQHWGHTDITFSLTGASDEFTKFVRLAFAAWQDVCGLTFTETTGVADISVIQPGGMNVNVVEDGIIQSSQVFASENLGVMLGAWEFGMGLVHETGHALGLFHGGRYNANATYGVQNHYGNDTFQYSVMSYFGQENYGGASFAYASSPQMADIYAVIQLYGEGSARSTDTVYGFNVSGHGATEEIYDFSNYGITITNEFGFTYTTAPAFTIYDTGGVDTLDCTGYAVDQNISLVSGTWSDIGGWKGNIAIYLTSTIENAVGGSGNDTIIGNAANNRIMGNAGNDVLVGGAGADALIGGLGIDTASYRDAPAGVRVDLSNPRKNAGEAAGDTYDSIENITGSAFADTLKGNHGANVLSGGGGNDILAGMGGDDTFYFAAASDGIDTIDNFDGDIVALSGDGFDLSDLQAGVNFIAGKAPAAVADTSTILYNMKTGTLYWDADGTGLQPAMPFAILGNKTPLTDSDFIIV